MCVWAKRFLVLAGIVCIAGCTTVYPDAPRVGTGTYSYAARALEWTYPVPLETAWQATLRAVEGLNLRADSKTLDGLGGQVTALRADGTNIHIRLKPETTRTTTVSVRVGTFGSQEQSENIHKAIRAQLNL
jgi:hypothetical protein